MKDHITLLAPRLKPEKYGTFGALGSKGAAVTTSAAIIAAAKALATENFMIESVVKGVCLEREEPAQRAVRIKQELK